MSTPLYQTIKKPTNGRRFAVGDVHGCCQTLKKMVEETLQLTKDDHLYLLGDYIDKGPDSAGTIDYIMALQAQSYQVYCLRGNHEENLLQAWQEYDSRTFRLFVSRINKSGDLLTEDAQIKPAYLHFFKNLPYYIVLDDYYLVHAGFDFTKMIF
ncbi:metallophosphoesterase family protein [Microscilla marina]|uniref:Metallophosphoesterase n=1 Tax=Microscilla marina ATCC 23134 TaxID=313606 RepID=A1ZS20_MICM2|nr:metallophosphoesterase family protein [Microscilla marina]EAY26743.1 metallophosphoesterase [Microscilla marina ATCC 23134]